MASPLKYLYTALLFVFHTCIEIVQGEYCTKYSSGRLRLEYCRYRCCGSSNDQYCCLSVGIIIGIVITCIGVVTGIVVLIICCRRRRASQGQVVAPPATVHYPGQNVYIVPPGGQAPVPNQYGGHPVAMNTSGAHQGFGTTPPPYAYDNKAAQP